MQQTLEAGGLEAGAELLVDPGVEGDRETHVEPGGDRPPRHLLPVPPDKRKEEIKIELERATFPPEKTRKQIRNRKTNTPT